MMAKTPEEQAGEIIRDWWAIEVTNRSTPPVPHNTQATVVRGGLFVAEVGLLIQGAINSAVAQERRRIVEAVESGNWMVWGEDYYQTFDSETSLKNLLGSINGTSH